MGPRSRLWSLPGFVDTKTLGVMPGEGVQDAEESRALPGGVPRRCRRPGATQRQTIAEVAADLGVSGESLRKWVQQAKIDAGEGPPGALTTEEQEELRRLRREDKTLQMEREILRKAAAFFAREAL